MNHDSFREERSKWIDVMLDMLVADAPNELKDIFTLPRLAKKTTDVVGCILNAAMQYETESDEQLKYIVEANKVLENALQNLNEFCIAYGVFKTATDAQTANVTPLWGDEFCEHPRN